MIIHKPSKSVLLRSRNPQRLVTILGRSGKLIDYKGHNVAVRHGVDETKVLNNLGIEVPSPILYHYNWPGAFTPWDHQKATAAFLTQHLKCFVFNEAGTAKTASALWAADYLMRVKKVTRVLIVAKLSTLECVWMKELFEVVMHRSAQLLYGTVQQRLERLNTPSDFYVINHEGIDVIFKELKKRKDIDLIILDEASDYRNSQTLKYELLESLLRPEMRFWPMTATPCPSYPTDAWALARLVSPGNVPKYFGQFRSRTMYKSSNFKWLPLPNHETIVHEALQPAIRFKKSECMDLPPVVTEMRKCQLSKEQKKALQTLKNKQVMVAKTGDQITAANAADAISKMLQVLCGCVKNTDTGEYIDLNYKDRFNVMLELIREASAKVIVVVPFKGIVYSLQKKLQPLISCEVVNGDVSPKKRNIIFNKFKTQKDPHVLLCHPKVMAHGLNLTEADTLIFFGPINSNDEALQVVERFNRAGQTRKMTVYKMHSHWLEMERYKVLDSRQASQERVLDLYKRVFLDRRST